MAIKDLIGLQWGMSPDNQTGTFTFPIAMPTVYGIWFGNRRDASNVYKNFTAFTSYNSSSVSYFTDDTATVKFILVIGK